MKYSQKKDEIIVHREVEGMFTKGIVLSESEYRSLWVDFIEMLKERIEELDGDERDELLKSRKKLEDWVKEQVIEMFEFVLEEHDAEEAVIFLKGGCHYLRNSEEFYYLSKSGGDIAGVIEALEEALKGSMKESRWQRKMR
jgi:adenylate cyclase